MRVIKNSFARIWALWGLLSFTASFLIIIIPALCSYLFPDEKKGQTFFIGLSKIWMKVWLFLVGCPVSIKGREHFTADHPYIVVFNHSSTMDIPVSCPFTPGANKTIGKSSFAKIPLFGLFYRKGTVLVDRKDERSRRRSYEQMKKVLLTGMHMCIYPEGTRNRTNELLKPFFDGAFRLATETKTDIIPCIIGGTREAMPMNKSMYLYPAKLSLTFLPAVSPEGLNAKELNKKVFEIMYRAMEEKQSEHPDHKS